MYKIIFPLLTGHVAIPAQQVEGPVPERHEVSGLRGRGGGRGLHGSYMAVKPSEGEEGTFRFALHGPDAIKLKFAVNKVLPSGLFTNMFVEAEMVVGDHIKLDNNTVCSDWLDVVELVKAQDVLVINDNDDDVGAEFLMAIESNKKDLVETTGKADNVGICLRWSLGTMGADTRIRLIAQVSCLYTIQL